MDSDSDEGSSAPANDLFRREDSDDGAAPTSKRQPRFLGDGDSDDGMAGMTVFGGRSGATTAGGKKRKGQQQDRGLRRDAYLDKVDDLINDLDTMPPELDLTIPDPLTIADPLALDASAFPDDEDAAGATKKKRKIVKLDEDRLMSPDGVPKLIELCKNFKMKGKGREMEDLKRLLKMYQLWAHQMYPKTNFEETFDTIETVCRKRTMQVALKEWREEAKGGKKAKLPLGKYKGDDEDGDAALNAALEASEPDDSSGPAPPAAKPVGAFDDEDMFDDLDLDDYDEDPIGPAPVAKPAPPPPPAKAPLFAAEDEFDFEAEEEAMREAELASAPRQPAATSSKDKEAAMPDDWDDEDLYA